jgi:hypothetical protein
MVNAGTVLSAASGMGMPGAAWGYLLKTIDSDAWPAVSERSAAAYPTSADRGTAWPRE